MSIPSRTVGGHTDALEHLWMQAGASGEWPDSRPWTKLLAKEV